MNDDTTPKATVTGVGYDRGLAGGTGYYAGGYESPEARGANPELHARKHAKSVAAARNEETGCVITGTDGNGTKWGHYF